MDHIVEPTEEEIISEASFIEMKAYVKYCLYFGYSRQEITSALKSVGWDDSEVSRAFSSVQPAKTFEKKPVQKEIPVPKAQTIPVPVPGNDIKALFPKGFTVQQEIEAPRPSS